ncbi:MULTISPECIES: hypothetical protein [unclassified Streptomyces]|uniref:hypothetical protein n=1 Tax=unclassified Streptomyces TaxID=2593676 RepID=UPI003826F686
MCGLERPARATIGDRVRLDGQLRQVLAMSAPAVTSGDTERPYRAMPLPELFGAEDFRVAGIPMRMPLPPASRLETFPEVVEKALR